MSGSDYNKIIILGNGFDLHLGLPTKWSDFIEFYEIIVNGSFEKFRFIKPKEWSFEEFKKNGSKWKNVDIVESYLLYALDNIKGDEEKENYKNNITSFIAEIKECKMLRLLLNLKGNSDEYKSFSWSDFEHLIEEILDSVDEYVDNLLNKSHDCDAEVFMNELLRLSINKLNYRDDRYFNPHYQVSNFNLKTDVINSKNKFMNFLFNELIAFTAVYKKYIDLIIDHLIQNHLRNSIHIENTLILTFNYTQDVVLFDDYASNDNRFYVHGKANKDIIIGISNEPKSEERIRFSKNYMRVYNRALDKDDKDVIDNINYINKRISEQTFSHYYFLGHSLDKIDHSFLRQLFKKNYYTKTTIFYYNNEDRQRKIFNLYLMVGEEFITQMLNNGSLEFVEFDEIETYNFCK